MGQALAQHPAGDPFLLLLAAVGRAYLEHWEDGKERGLWRRQRLRKPRTAARMGAGSRARASSQPTFVYVPAEGDFISAAAPPPASPLPDPRRPARSRDTPLPRSLLLGAPCPREPLPVAQAWVGVRRGGARQPGWG